MIRHPSGPCRSTMVSLLSRDRILPSLATWILLSLATQAKSPAARALRYAIRSEEHTSELQSLMRISYAVFCLKKKKKHQNTKIKKRKIPYYSLKVMSTNYKQHRTSI